MKIVSVYHYRNKNYKTIIILGKVVHENGNYYI